MVRTMPKRKLEEKEQPKAEFEFLGKGEPIYVNLLAESSGSKIINPEYAKYGKWLDPDTGPAVFMVEILSMAEELAVDIWGQEAVDNAETMIADALRRVEERNAS